MGDLSEDGCIEEVPGHGEAQVRPSVTDTLQGDREATHSQRCRRRGGPQMPQGDYSEEGLQRPWSADLRQPMGAAEEAGRGSGTRPQHHRATPETLRPGETRRGQSHLQHHWAESDQRSVPTAREPLRKGHPQHSWSGCQGVRHGAAQSANQAQMH